jgi:hypothetical protein
MGPLYAQRTFHLDVDPIQGDDQTALASNPTGSTAPGAARPLQTHPGAPGSITGELQHAPYPFRTVTAAVRWVNNLPLNAAGTPLPYTNPETEEVVDAVIIHCMPGLYGPRDQSTQTGHDDFDPASGLPWNGESFPITLPGRVSLQGTSALDTIFDARDYELSTGSNLILFDRTSGNEPAGAYDESFVDSLALRGCRYRGSSTGAAIRFASSGDVQPSISNCFIYANDVGILIDNPDPIAWDPHRPKIVNNTIAWNQIGIYSSAITIEQFVGHARPIVLNNLIDPIRFGAQQVPATAPYLAGIGAGTSEAPSCFEGLDESDLRAWVIGITPQPRNYNGYHDGLRNQSPPNTWPYGATMPRTANPLLPPVVDLAPLHGPWTGIRSSALFVSDVMVVTGANPPASRSDLRLAPMTFSAEAGFQPNLAVNWGISTVTGPIQCANGSLLTAPPGRAGDDLATFHAWDWDCEGFGNPRQASRRLGTGSHFPEPWGSNDTIDLGADEMGELIVGGYIESTRIFSRPHASIAPNTASLTVSQLYFFNVHWPLAPSTTTYVSPQFNARFDAIAFTAPTGPAEWFAQLGPNQNPFNPLGTAFAYTDGQYWTGPFTNRYRLTGPAAVFPTRPHAPLPYFARHRVCDIGPHLADDINVPSWGSSRELDYAEYDFSVTWQSPPPAVRDVFQANCWFETLDPNADPGNNDNRYLYIDGQNQRLRHGTLSPPLVLANEELQTAFPNSYLYRSATHPIGSWLPPPYTYDVAVSGMSLPMPQLPYVSTAPWYGARINLELFQPDNPLWASLGSPVNNVQTFLVVEGPTAAQQQSSSPPSDLLLQNSSERAAAIFETERAMAELVRENNR